MTAVVANGAVGDGHRASVVVEARPLRTGVAVDGAPDYVSCALEIVYASTVAGSTAVGGGVGGATGAVGGAISGGVGLGAAVGAAMGATVGLFRGLFRASEPTPAYKSFMNRCLKDRGYESIGWE